jgi:hypothetical protein
MGLVLSLALLTSPAANDAQPGVWDAMLGPVVAAGKRLEGAALVWRIHPGMTPAQVRGLLGFPPFAHPSYVRAYSFPAGARGEFFWQVEGYSDYGIIVTYLSHFRWDDDGPHADYQVQEVQFQPFFP